LVVTASCRDGAGHDLRVNDFEATMTENVVTQKAAEEIAQVKLL
jgi:hypothetical protein